MQGAIFDLDGTVLDSMPIWDTVSGDYLRSLGFQPKEDIDETFKDLNFYQAACRYRSEYGVELSVDAIMDGVSHMVGHYYKYEAPLKLNVDRFLEQLSQNGVKMCIATATPLELAQAALERCGVSGYFSKIFTCGITDSGKEEPRIYREALRHLGTEKSKTIVFEDALFALRTAKADGFLTAGVYDTHEKCQKELRELADYYIIDYSDVGGVFF